MFRKPKGKGKKASLRSRESEAADGVEGISGDGGDLSGEANKDADSTVRSSKVAGKKRALGVTVSAGVDDAEKTVMHQYGESKEPMLTPKDLATREATHHPEEQQSKRQKEATEEDEDREGLYKGTKQKRNKFLAGPIRAATYVRTTCRFDYQPDICKDYKDTGFCGYGDTCIYLHDRGDSLTGWQLEKQWEEQRQKEQEAKQREMEKFVGDLHADKSSTEPNAVAEDGIPFACHLCRNAFTDPVVTACGHYFCEACIIKKVRGSAATSRTASACPVCGKDTYSVFHHPTKLLAKKRRLVGSSGSWQDFADAVSASRQPTSPG